MKNVKVSQTRKLHPRAWNVRRKFERMLHALAWVSIETRLGLQNSSRRYEKGRYFGWDFRHLRVRMALTGNGRATLVQYCFENRISLENPLHISCNRLRNNEKSIKTKQKSSRTSFPVFFSIFQSILIIFSTENPRQRILTWIEFFN